MSAANTAAFMKIQDQQVAENGDLILSIKAWTEERSYDIPYKIPSAKIADTSFTALKARVLTDLEERIAMDEHREHMISFYEDKVDIKVELRK